MAVSVGALVEIAVGDDFGEIGTFVTTEGEDDTQELIKILPIMNTFLKLSKALILLPFRKLH